MEHTVKTTLSGRDNFFLRWSVIYNNFTLTRSRAKHLFGTVPTLTTTALGNQ